MERGTRVVESFSLSLGQTSARYLRPLQRKENEGEKQGKRGKRLPFEQYSHFPSWRLYPSPFIRCEFAPRVNVGEWGTSSVGTKLR